MFKGFPDGSVVKNVPAVQERKEMQVQSLGQENPLEEEIATHSSFLPGKLRGKRSLVGYSPWSHKDSDMTEQLSTQIGSQEWKRANVLPIDP